MFLKQAFFTTISHNVAPTETAHALESCEGKPCTHWCADCHACAHTPHWACCVLSSPDIGRRKTSSASLILSQTTKHCFASEDVSRDVVATTDNLRDDGENGGQDL